MLCYNCFKEIDDGSCKCCDYSEMIYVDDWTMVDRGLYHGSILNGRYITGRIIALDEFGITYKAQDYFTKELIVIREYAPTEYCFRNYENPVHVKCKAEEFKLGIQKFFEDTVNLARLKNRDGKCYVRQYFEENGTAYVVMKYIEGISLEKYSYAFAPAIGARDRKEMNTYNIEKICERSYLNGKGYDYTILLNDGNLIFKSVIIRKKVLGSVCYHTPVSYKKLKEFEYLFYSYYSCDLDDCEQEDKSTNDPAEQLKRIFNNSVREERIHGKADKNGNRILFSQIDGSISVWIFGNGADYAEKYTFFDDIVVDICHKCYGIQEKNSKMEIITPEIPKGAKKEFRCKKCAAKLPKDAKICPECGSVVEKEREYSIFSVTARFKICQDTQRVDIPIVISSKTNTDKIISKLIELELVPNLHYNVAEILNSAGVRINVSGKEPYYGLEPNAIICFERNYDYKLQLSCDEKNILRQAVTDSIHTSDEMHKYCTVFVRLNDVRLFNDVTLNGIVFRKGERVNDLIQVKLAPFDGEHEMYYELRHAGFDAGSPQIWPKLIVPYKDTEVELDAIACEIGNEIIDVGPQIYV